MKRYLLIAEKPSLMRDIRACYMNHKQELNQKIGEITFIALSGHVCGNLNPDEYPQWEGIKWEQIDYPMIPAAWRIKPIDDKKKKETLEIIQKNIRSMDGVIVATDSDTEGYGIYWMLEKYLGIEDVPALRFIEHSQTEPELYSQLLRMTDYHTDPVHVRQTQSYLLRSRADWLYGMNGSRIMSVKTNELMRVGRVKAPTIKMIYDNSMAINHFEKKTYYQLDADYGGWKATLSDEEGTALNFQKNENIASFPLDGEVVLAETKREAQHAPKLFDLASIQVEAGNLYDYSPAHTLQIIQSLYETHKVISYPRTQCRFVSTEKAKEFPMMLQHMSAFPDLAEIAKEVAPSVFTAILKDKQVVNDKEVLKESHDALLPTSNRANPAAMTEEERNVCHLIYARLLMQFLPKATDDKVKVQIQHGDGLFTANGKTVVEQGWRRLANAGKDAVIPPLQKGQRLTALKIEPSEKRTSPPKRLTQATLIDAMKKIANQIEDKELRKSLADSQGIGTPATRAAIITEILKTGYAVERGGKLFITKLGEAYIDSLKGIDIVEPEFAAVMDTEIKRVQRGESEYEAVYQEIIDKLHDMCRKMESLPQRKRAARGTEMPEKCPACGKNLVMTKWYYQCPDDDAHFKIQKQPCGVNVNEKMLVQLLGGETLGPFEFTKKDGTKFQARIQIAGNELKFVFTSGIACPACGGDLTINRGGAFCSACGFKLFRKTFGNVVLDDVQLKNLLIDRVTDRMTFEKKDGTGTYEAKLLLVEDPERGWDKKMSFEN